MKLIGLEEGAVTELFPTEEMSPERGANLKKAVEAIQATYGFHTVPDLSLDWDTLQQETPLKFSGGEITIDGRARVIKELSLYSDGIVVRSYHTDDSQAFLSDFISWGKATLGFRDTISEPRRLYSSTVVVEFSNNINNFIKGIDKLTALLSEQVKKYREIDEPINVVRIDFGPDPSTIPNRKPIENFMMERRINTIHSENRYITRAPLPTGAHLDLLTQVEDLADNL